MATFNIVHCEEYGREGVPAQLLGWKAEGWGEFGPPGPSHVAVVIYDDNGDAKHLMSCDAAAV